QVVINNGTLTVNPAPLTVTVASLSRFYGDPNPVLLGRSPESRTVTTSRPLTRAWPRRPARWAAMPS
ncbi:MAG TPA: hypothetical protein VN679_09985, partial [Candidatus Acidoferrales bacterium]|nr:hypothetical protein [Candidatus Acidoferrales bacterium]